MMEPIRRRSIADTSLLILAWDSKRNYKLVAPMVVSRNLESRAQAFLEVDAVPWILISASEYELTPGVRVQFLAHFHRKQNGASQFVVKLAHADFQIGIPVAGLMAGLSSGVATMRRSRLAERFRV